MIITHDLGVVAGIADRVVVMYAGRTVESGPTDAIFADPRMPYTIGLLKSIPRLDALPGERLEPIPGQPPDVSGSIRACSFAPRCEFFVAGRCDREVPPLRPVGTGQGAACLFDVTAETVGRRVAPATAPFAVQGAQEG
jgi:oligopeptide transport system ATP-binding protein